jgi:hypothetical protein
VLAAILILWLGFLIVLAPRPSPWIVVASGLPLLVAASWRGARRRSRPWRAFVEETADYHALGLVLLYALGVQMADAHGITTDGVTYFTQLRSVVFDRDLDIAREYAFLGQPPRPNHVVPIGPVLVWLPLYLLVTLLDGAGRLVGAWSAPADPIALGLGLPYVRAALISSFTIGAVGLVAIHWYLRREFSRAVAFVTTLLVFGATPLVWYMVYEPSMTHAASFGFVALFVVCAARWFPSRPAPGAGDSRRDSEWSEAPGAVPSRRDPLPTPHIPDAVDPLPTPTRRQAVILGTLLGLAFQARSQEALFAIFPALLVLGGAAAERDRLRSALRLAGWAFLGALPWILIQLLHSYVLFTRYEYDLFGQGGYFNPLRSRWIDTLFSSWHGFLSWSPVAYVAVLGTMAYARREWRWAVSALVILLLTAWVNGSTQDWAGGWSFGGRRFTSALVMLAPGLAMAIEFAVRRPLVAVAPVVAAALWWNYLLMVQYTANLLPKDEAVGFGRIVRQQAELHTRPPYWYAFAFPANVWFAWREGLPVDKYDVLSPETPRGSIDLVFDRTVEKYLLDGWDAPGGDDWGPCWWIGGSPATMAVPLAPEPGPLVVTVRSRTRFEEPPVQASLALEVNGHEVGRFDAGVPGASTSTIGVPADVAARVFRDGFNRVSFRSLGVTPLDPGAPAAEPNARRRDAVWPVAIYELQIAPAVR